MSPPNTSNDPGARFLLITASLVVTVYGLRLAAPILQIFFLALFLAVLSLPIMFTLMKRRIPRPVAIGVTVLVDLGIFALLILLASGSLQRFQAKFPVLRDRAIFLIGGWQEELEALDIPVSDYLSLQSLNFDDLLGLFGDSALNILGGTVQWVAAFLTALFLVVLVMIFILNEATVFPKKFRAIAGRGISDDSKLTKVIQEVQAYLVIKTVISLGTGIVVGLATWALGLDLFILLGLIAFLLNFIPNIGSAIAALPAIALAFLEIGLGRAIVVALVYLGVNVIFGNFLEPSLMGRRLGLSTLVVILSLLFWTFVWGVVGAVLAVPLTMVVKILLENTEDLRWVAVLLDKSPPAAAAQSAQPSG